MESNLTRDECVRLWSVLSDVFVDNEIDYPWIARQVAGVDRDTVEAAFFHDVAPACYSNLLTPIPPVWTLFDSDWLAETIDSARKARRRSVIRRLCDQALVAYLRYALKDEWLTIERELDRLLAEPTAGRPETDPAG